MTSAGLVTTDSWLLDSRDALACAELAHRAFAPASPAPAASELSHGCAISPGFVQTLDLNEAKCALHVRSPFGSQTLRCGCHPRTPDCAAPVAARVALPAVLA